MTLAESKLRVGQKLTLNPAKESFVDNSAADAMLTRPYRAPLSCLKQTRSKQLICRFVQVVFSSNGHIHAMCQFEHSALPYVTTRYGAIMATCRQLVFVCLATLIFGSTLLAQNAKSQATVAKGDVLKFTFNKSKIFPGTVRDCWVYVPKQYKPETPACVYVNQDGLQYKANEVFDRLIASGEMRS